MVGVFDSELLKMSGLVIAARTYRRDPEDPPPLQPADNNASNQGPDRWSKQRRDKVEAQDGSSLVSLKHIGDGASTVRHTHTTKEARQCPQNNERLDVGRQRGRYLQQREDSQVPYEQVPPTECL